MDECELHSSIAVRQTLRPTFVCFECGVRVWVRFGDCLEFFFAVMSKRSAGSQDKHQEERDPIAEVIGNYGLYQLKITFLLSLCSFPCTFHIFSPTFVVSDFLYN